MNVKKMASKDAVKWAVSMQLNDTINVKSSTIPGYADAFDKVFAEIRDRIFPAHKADMYKLRSQLEKANKPGSKKGLLLLLAGVGVAIYTRPDKKFLNWYAREEHPLEAKFVTNETPYVGYDDLDAPFLKDPE